MILDRKIMERPTGSNKIYVRQELITQSPDILGFVTFMNTNDSFTVMNRIGKYKNVEVWRTPYYPPWGRLNGWPNTI